MGNIVCEAFVVYAAFKKKMLYEGVSDAWAESP